MFTTSLVKRHRRRPRWLCHFNQQEQGRLQLVHQFNDSKQIKLKCTSRAHKQAQVQAKSFSQQHANHVQVQARSSAKYNKQHERIQLSLFPRQTRRSGFQALSALEHYQQHETFANSCNPTGAHGGAYGSRGTHDGAHGCRGKWMFNTHRSKFHLCFQEQLWQTFSDWLPEAASQLRIRSQERSRTWRIQKQPRKLRPQLSKRFQANDVQGFKQQKCL